MKTAFCSAAAVRRTVLYAFIPLAAFMAGWSLRPPASGSSHSPGKTVLLTAENSRHSLPASPPASRSGDIVSLAKHPGPAGRVAALLLHAETLDAAGALSELKALNLQSPGPESRTARQILLTRYADLDPETALTYVDTLPVVERTESSVTIMSTWASRDPRAAAAHLQEDAGGFGLTKEATASSAATVARAWVSQDPQAATQWVAGLTDDLRGDAVPAAAQALTAGNPEAGVAWASGLPQGQERNSAVSSVALQWAQATPAAAAAWVNSLSDPSSQAAGAEGLITAWMQSDPAAASAWVNSLTPGPTRDAAIVVLTQSPAIANDAESAVTWASSIQDPALRQSTLPDTISRWIYQNPAAAEK